MKTCNCFGITCVLILIMAAYGSFAQEETSAERPVYTIPEELREASQKLVGPSPKYRVGTPIDIVDPDTRRLFLLEYLESEDAKMREAAVDLLAQSLRNRRNIRASAFQKYLSADYPVDVRVVSLAFYIKGFDAHREGYTELSEKEQIAWRRERRAVWSKALDDIVGSGRSSANVDTILLAMSPMLVTFSETGERRLVSPLELLKPENRAVFARMALDSTSHNSEYFGNDETAGRVRRQALEVISEFPVETLADVLPDWYSVELNKDARRAVVDSLKSIFRSPKKLRKLKVTLQVVANDEDEEIATQAKELLKKIKE